MPTSLSLWGRRTARSGLLNDGLGDSSEERRKSGGRSEYFLSQFRDVDGRCEQARQHCDFLVHLYVRWVLRGLVSYLGTLVVNVLRFVTTSSCHYQHFSIE